VPPDKKGDGDAAATAPRLAPGTSCLEIRSRVRIVYWSIAVKYWAEFPPPVEAVRPSRCLGCGKGAYAADGSLLIHGHGVRGRVVQGPGESGKAVPVAELVLRRYQCQACGAVMHSAPGGVLRRCVYLGGAIAQALGRWVDGAPAREVRAEVSGQRVLGATAAAGWASLGRWVRGASKLWPRLPTQARGSVRERATQVVAFLASYALVPSGQRTVDAMAGATHA
jgi:hypothetical protein